MWMSLCVKAIAAARQLDSTYYKMPPTAVPSRISKLVGRGPSTRPCRHRSVNVRKRQQKKRAMKMYPKQRKQKKEERNEKARAMEPAEEWAIKI